MPGKFIALAQLDQFIHNGKVCTISGVVHTSWDGAAEEARGWASRWAEPGRTSYVAELQYEAYVTPPLPPTPPPPPEAYLRWMPTRLEDYARPKKATKGTW